MARLVQALFTIGGMCAALAAFFWIETGWLGVLLAVVAFFGLGAGGDRLFRRIATPEQIRADLEQRARADQ